MGSYNQSQKKELANAYKECQRVFNLPLKIGDHILQEESDCDNFLSQDAKFSHGDLLDPKRLGKELAQEIKAAIKAPDVKAIWLNDTFYAVFKEKKKEIGQFYDSLFTELNTLERHRYSLDNQQKPVMGFCFTLPLVTFLGIRGFARPVHTYHFNDAVNNLREHETELMKDIIFNAQSTVNIANITPMNDTAFRLQNGESIKGTIIGGLLHAFYQGLNIIFSIEKSTQKNIISGKPIILFLELLDYGDEIKSREQEISITDQLLKLVGHEKLNIKAFFLADTLPNKTKDEEQKKQYHENIAAKLEEIAKLGNSYNVPIYKGLEIGHAGRNSPLPMGLAEVKTTDFNHESKTVALQIQYTNLKGAFPFWNSSSTATTGAIASSSDDFTNDALVEESWSSKCPIS